MSHNIFTWNNLAKPKSEKNLQTKKNTDNLLIIFILEIVLYVKLNKIYRF